MSPTSPSALQRLRRLDKSSSSFHDQLSNVLYAEEYKNCVPNLPGDDSAWLIEYLNEALDDLGPSSAAFRKCLRELRRLCGARGILPTSYTLSSDLLGIGPDPFASGGYGDVYHGSLNGSRVCIKRVRGYSSDDPEKAAKIFCREAVMWKHLKHPNIIPLLGVTINPFQLISEWMPSGDLPDYIGRNPSADRLGLLSDVAEGLSYLHFRNMVHGDLKGPNILVDNSGRARITDFGQAKVTQSLDTMRSASRHGNTPRWAAPEVLEEHPPSKESDIFSLAMVMIEVFTGAVPFSDRSTVMTILAVTQGGRPSRPTHPALVATLWTLIQRCWDQEPHLRPEASEVSRALLTLERPTWQRLISRTLTADERTTLIVKIFSDRDEVEMAEHLSGDDAQTFIDVIAEALDGLAPEIRMGCLHFLYKICGHQALLPGSPIIPLDHDVMSDPLYHGRFADVWKGQHRGRDVAAKVLKLQSKDNPEQIRRRFCAEVVVWNTLRHKNILPLLGVTTAEGQLVMVSEWMVGGNIMEFVKVNVHADRLKLLGDATRGLIFMHDQGIAHGGLRGENILVGRTGHACLSGFSRLTIASDQPATTPLAAPDDAIQWMSPELIAPTKFNLKESRPTKKSDCYSLGMAIYEVLSEKVPFAPRESTAITSDVVGGERPGRPQGGEGARFTDGLWWMLEDCWKPQPDDRPSLDIVLGCLQDGGKRFAQLRRGNPKSGWTSKLFNTLKAFKFHTGRTRES